MKHDKYKARDYQQIMTKLFRNTGADYHAKIGVAARVTVPEGMSERAISPKAFQEISAYLQLEGVLPKQAAQMAYPAVKLFRSSDRVLQYLNKWGAAKDQALSHLLTDLPVIKHRHINLKHWGDAILQQGPKMMSHLNTDSPSASPKRRYMHGAYSIVETASACRKIGRNMPPSNCRQSFQNAGAVEHQKQLFDPRSEFHHGLPFKR